MRAFDRSGQFRKKIQRHFYLLFICLLLIVTRSVYAHSPHDVIDALSLSPSFNRDQVLFITISANLLKSSDGGYTWQGIVNGLDNKYLFTDIVMSPSYSYDATIYLSSDGDGIYKSKNKGLSWSKVNSGLDELNIGKLVISPNYEYDNKIFAIGKSGSLFVSNDGANTWGRLVNDEIKISALAFLSSNGKQHVLSGDVKGNLYLSTDGGTEWRHINSAGFGSAITAIAVSPRFATDQTVFIGTQKHLLFKSIDGGKTFKATNQNLNTGGPIVAVNVSPNYESDKKVVVTAWYEAVFISVDGGQSWRKHDKGLTTDSQADKAKYRSAHFRDVSFSNDFKNDKVVFVGGYDGLFKSYDGGFSWQQLETLPLKIIKAMGVGSMAGVRTAVGIGTYGGGGYVTQDDGKNWIISSLGLKRTRLSDFVFSPTFASDDTAFAGASGSLLKSVNGGRRWEINRLELSPWKRRLNNGLSKLGLGYLAKKLFPLSNKRSPYPTKIVLSPDYSADKQLFFGTRDHGIFKSVNGGDSSERVWKGHGKVISEFVISPAYNKDQTLYVCVRGEGIYKSMDSGESWQPVNNGLDVIQEWNNKILHGVKTNDLILAISPEYADDNTVFAASSHGLYKTVNGGKLWRKTKDPIYGSESYVIAIAVSPEFKNDKSILISVKGKGLFESVDGGDSFSEWSTSLVKNNQEVNSISFSPHYAQDKKVYAASYLDLFVSSDGGVSWDTIKRPVRYENHREVVKFSGDWKMRKGDDYSASKVSYSDTAGSEVGLKFVGAGVKWIGTRSDSQGLARVYLDGEYVTEVDQYGDSGEALVEAYTADGLSYGPHSIRIEVTGKSNPKSQGHRIELDAFDVLP